MNSRSYFDSASVSASAKYHASRWHGPRLTTVLTRIVPAGSKKDWEVTFAGNATQVLKNILLGIAGCNRVEKQCRVYLNSQMHPVFRKCTLLLCNAMSVVCKEMDFLRSSSKLGQTTSRLHIMVVPITCWRTGTVIAAPQDLRTLRKNHPAAFIIADAVQCPGNLPVGLLDGILSDDGADVVLERVLKNRLE